MRSPLAVEEDRPKLADRILRTPLRDEDRVADPECLRTRRMVGAYEKALVVPLRLTTIAGEIHPLRECLQLILHLLLRLRRTKTWACSAADPDRQVSCSGFTREHFTCSAENPLISVVRRERTAVSPPGRWA